MNAYAYFDRNGNLKEFITDPSVRKGNSGYNGIYVYWHESPAVEVIGALFRPTKLYSEEDVYETAPSTAKQDVIIPSDKTVDLKFFKAGQKYKMWYVALPENIANNNYDLTLSMYLSEYKKVNLAMLTFTVDEAVAITSPQITTSQYDSLFFRINNTFTKSESRSLVKRNKLLFTHITEYELDEYYEHEEKYVFFKDTIEYEEDVTIGVLFKLGDGSQSFDGIIWDSSEYELSYVKDGVNTIVWSNGEWVEEYYRYITSDSKIRDYNFVLENSDVYKPILNKVIFKNNTNDNLYFAYSTSNWYHSNKNKYSPYDFIHKKKKYMYQEPIAVGKELRIIDLLMLNNDFLQYINVNQDCQIEEPHNIKSTIYSGFSFTINMDIQDIIDGEYEMFRIAKLGVNPGFDIDEYIWLSQTVYILNMKTNKDYEHCYYTNKVYGALKMYFKLESTGAGYTKMSVYFGDIYK